MKTKINDGIYGAFFIGEMEVALNVTSIQEVVNFPEKVIKMPLAPDFLVGVFNLRGIIIPIINLKSLLKIENQDIHLDQKVGIVEHEGARVGLLFDSTSEILRIETQEVSQFSYNGENSYKVISGAIKLEEGRRIVQIIDPFSLVTIENIPQILDQQNRINAGKNRSQAHLGNRKKCITISNNDIVLGLEITSIHEIIRVPEIKKSAIQQDLCLGMVSLRGQIVPLIDLSLLLGDQPSVLKQDSEQRIIVLKLDAAYFGLLVEEVRSISTYSENEIMPIPLLSKKRAGLFSGCVTINDIGDVILLNCSELLSHQEVSEITLGHSKIYSSTESEEKKTKNNVNKQTYISFRLEQLLAVSIKDVREIINYSPDIIAAPGMPVFVKGVLNLRGKLITIIDTRALYRLEQDLKTQEESKILIFENEGERFGLVVDTVESIVSIDESRKMKVPSLMVQRAQDQFQNDIKEIVTYQQQDEKEGVLIILNIEPVTSRIRGSIAA